MMLSRVLFVLSIRLRRWFYLIRLLKSPFLTAQYSSWWANPWLNSFALQLIINKYIEALITTLYQVYWLLICVLILFHQVANHEWDAAVEAGWTVDKDVGESAILVYKFEWGLEKWGDVKIEMILHLQIQVGLHLARLNGNPLLFLSR